MLIIDPPIHPGEILRTEFMEPLDISAGRLAKAIHVPRTRVERLARQETRLTPDTAARLGRYFRTGPEFWLNIQASHDASVLAKDAARQREIETIVPLERPDLAA